MIPSFLPATRILPLLSFLLSFAGAYAQPAVSYHTLLSSGLTEPVDLAHAGDGSGRLFLAEKGGLVKIYRNGALLPAPFLDLRSVVSTEGDRGLLSLAFHPQYAANGYFFVYYTRTGDGAITLARYKVSATNPDEGDTNSGVVLLTIPKPPASDGTTFKDHNGGKLNFGPDGYLYFATGDGGKEGPGDPYNNAQDGNSLLGKMIRIDVTAFTVPPFYSIPPDNPFTADAAVRDEIWALGLRNPWRWSFDRANGDLWIGDVGHVLWEEIDYVPAGSGGGQNFGWRCFEGSAAYNTSGCGAASGYHAPLYEYANTASAPASITGGYVYRGSEYPLLGGYYVAADIYTGTIYLVKRDGGGGWTVSEQPNATNFVISFGEGENGALYALSYTGRLYAVVATGILPLRLSQLSVAVREGTLRLQWEATGEEGIRRYTIEGSTDGRSFRVLGSVAARGHGGGTYSWQGPAGEARFFRLAIEEEGGKRTYSAVVRAAEGGTAPLRLAGTEIRDGLLRVELGEPALRLQLAGSNGVTLLEEDLRGRTGSLVLTLPAAAKGVYVVLIRRVDGTMFRQKIIIR